MKNHLLCFLMIFISDPLLGQATENPFIQIDPTQGILSPKKEIDSLDVPLGIKESFSTIYPGVLISKWYAYSYYLDTETDEIQKDTVRYIEYLLPELYEVHFEKSNRLHTGLFSRSGKHVQTKNEIRSEELPDEIDKILKSSKFKEWTILKKMEKIVKHHPSRTLYKVTIAKEDEKRVLYYEPNGKLAQVKIIKLYKWKDGIK